MFGTNLRNLRVKNNLTQEQLAKELFISDKMVSKWERGDADPDLKMLISIARFFQCSLDELIGFNITEEKEQVQNISREWEKNNSSGLHKENVELISKAMQQYPRNYLLMIELAATLEQLPGTEDEKRKNIRESIRLQERTIKECEDPEICNATRYNICFSYWLVGEKDKAIEKAQSLPNYYKTRENALIFLWEGKERLALSREAIGPIMYALVHHLLAISEDTKQNRYLKKAEMFLYEMKGDLPNELFNRLEQSIEKRKE